MLSFNNDHIFTGYLKQLLSSFNLPACKVYTKEYIEYYEKYGKEDPRIIKSFNDINDTRLAIRVNYLKNDELYHYLSNYSENIKSDSAVWKKSSNLYYAPEKSIFGLTRNLYSPGISYDTKTHEYLGDYLRFMRDYYNINLMSLYNCFTDKIYSNIYFNFKLASGTKVLFNAQEPEYKLYALPVKLFADYTIAIDCDQGIEMFCGLYSTDLDMSRRAEDLAARTYQRINKTLFRQPFLYDKLNISHWLEEDDFTYRSNNREAIRTDRFTRWDIVNREKDLKLFIKIPVSCKSSVTILEGDYRSYNDVKYMPVAYKADNTPFNANIDPEDAEIKNVVWTYKNNRCVLNFNKKDKLNLNNSTFKPISKLQLLAFNTGESYPFSDRLVEYLCGSAVMPIDEIPDNIKRVQKVMQENGYYFKIDGLWENKMQYILYDYIMNSGPVKVENGKIVDKRKGYHKTIGHSSKSTLYDVLGYADKDVEKWYASWKKYDNEAIVDESLQNVDIYNGLYNI